MRITIDTKRDSIDEIEKVISLVRELMGKSSNESSGDDFSMPESGVMGIFESNNSEHLSEEKKDDDRPGIITY